MRWERCVDDDDTYAALRRAIEETLGTKPYPMTLVGEDCSIVVKAWNQGIDAHLQAFTRSSATPMGKRMIFSIDPDELPILVRRLFEDAEGEELAYSILESLDIECEP